MSLSDEDYAALAEDVPSPSDPFIQQFIKGSTALHHQEAGLRADAPFRKSLSPIAKRADAIVARIRAHEISTVWRPSEQPHHEMTVHPGMLFPQAKPLLETTNLWRIVKRMPKGSALHSHLDGMVDFDHVLDVLMSTPGMHISAEAPLSSPKALSDAVVRIRFRKKEDSEHSIWSDDYVPATWRSIMTAADEYPHGGKQGFLRWLKDQCTLTQKESIEKHHGPDNIWHSFGRCFHFSDSIIYYEPIFRAFLRRLMKSLHEDSVSWIELRYDLPLTSAHSDIPCSQKPGSPGAWTTFARAWKSPSRTLTPCSLSWKKSSNTSRVIQLMPPFGASEPFGRLLDLPPGEVSFRTWIIALPQSWHIPI